MSTVELESDVGTVDLWTYTMGVIEDLKKDRKYPAVHTYLATLRSFRKFAGAASELLPAGKPLSTHLGMHEVFTPGRLKEYEEWLLQRELSLDTVSTYMRTLQAIYRRWQPLGSPKYNPKLFEAVYTKVVAHTKRALTEQQISRLMNADFDTLPPERQCVLAYFLLTFLFRGMPFVDLAHLRKRDVHGDKIIYCRHKTGKKMVVDIPKEALRLIREYKDRRPGSIYLFPILDTGAKDGWQLFRCYCDTLRHYNKSLQRVARILLPGVRISSYTARHTWATLAYHMGVSVGIICQSLGHSSVKVTETYLKPFEDDRIDKVNRKLISLVRKCKWVN